MYIQADRGLVGKLRSIRTKKNILYSPAMRESASISASILSFADLAGATSEGSVNSDDGADDVDIYSFELNGTRYAGVTRRVTFEDGDEVELAYEERKHGREVFGIRRAATRSIWLYPYMSCGSTAAVLHGIEQWLKWSVGFSGFILLIASAFNLMGGWGYLSANEVIYIVVITFAMLLLCACWMFTRLFRFAKAADEVFSAMGFENPKMVNLHKTSKAYRKKHNVVWIMKNNAELWY